MRLPVLRRRGKDRPARHGEGNQGEGAEQEQEPLPGGKGAKPGLEAGHGRHRPPPLGPVSHVFSGSRSVSSFRMRNGSPRPADASRSREIFAPTETRSPTASSTSSTSGRRAAISASRRGSSAFVFQQRPARQ